MVSGKRGTAIGLYYTSTVLLALVSSVIAGLLWDKVSPSVPFLLGSFAALAAAVIMMVMLP
jgi:hypothetical protein